MQSLSSAPNSLNNGELIVYIGIITIFTLIFVIGWTYDKKARKLSEMIKGYSPEKWKILEREGVMDILENGILHPTQGNVLRQFKACREVCKLFPEDQGILDLSEQLSHRLKVTIYTLLGCLALAVLLMIVFN